MAAQVPDTTLHAIHDDPLAGDFLDRLATLNDPRITDPGKLASGLSALVEVLLRRDDRLYLNDGMYGIFWELRFKEHGGFPARVWRDGVVHRGPQESYRLYGPTCDATDVVPERIMLPDDLRVGDFIEFGSIGAYSLSGRTRFNGYYSDRVIMLSDPGARPPD
jgi:ornithine decarboxylase